MSARPGVSYRGTGHAVISTGWTMHWYCDAEKLRSKRRTCLRSVEIRARSRRWIAASRGVARVKNRSLRERVRSDLEIRHAVIRPSTIASSHEPLAFAPRRRIARVFVQKTYWERRRFDGTPPNSRE